MFTKSLSLFALPLFVASLTVACAAPTTDDAQSTDDAAEQDLSAAAPQFFVATGPGLTGGLSVRAVNLDTTKCADGKKKGVCPVVNVNLDWKALGITDDAQNKSLEDAFAKGHMVVKGTLRQVTTRDPVSITYPVLDVTEAWQGMSGHAIASTASFYSLRQMFLACGGPQADCPSVSQTLLNGKNQTMNVAGVDYTSLHLHAADVRKADGAMLTGDLIVAGIDRGLTRAPMSLAADEAFLKIVPKPDFTSCANDTQCVAVPAVGCCHNGWNAAVNVDQKDAYAHSFVCNEQIMCPMYMVHDTRVAKCVAAKCTMVEAPAQP